MFPDAGIYARTGKVSFLKFWVKQELVWKVAEERFQHESWYLYLYQGFLRIKRGSWRLINLCPWYGGSSSRWVMEVLETTVSRTHDISLQAHMQVPSFGVVGVRG
jgi:hypothetical protein